uniref:Nuclear pore complex protein n=1 Tax=Meloidogyne incognita TaxID=6306 RepID=A0A914LZC2_MELIC
MIDDSSIITESKGHGYSNCDITSILSMSGGSNSDRENHPNEFASLQFLDRNELLVKLTRIIFEDFCTHILGMHSRITHNKENKDECFLELLRKFLEICECGVNGIEKFCNDSSHIDPHSKILLNQLTLERASYALILRMHDSEKLLNDNQVLVSTSILTKLFRESEQFRRISTLLLWNEECSLFSPTDFSRISNEDALKLTDTENIYASTKLRNPVHIDSRFVDRLVSEDEESIKTLNTLLFSLIRSGRLEEAKSLLDNVGLPALSIFILIREFLTNQKLTPLDRFEDNFILAQSRLYFKQMARELIPMEGKGRVHPSDQCIWATISGHLPTLFNYANSSEDRLWALLNCAVEAILDNSLANLHSTNGGRISLIFNDLSVENEDVPKDIHSIFKQIQIYDENPYYALFEFLSLEDWPSVAKYIGTYLNDNQSQKTANELRYFIHLLLLLKFSDRLPSNLEYVLVNLIENYSSILIQMKLNPLVPFYLFHLPQKEQSFEKMLNFLEGITFEPEQNEILDNAQNVGFDVPQLCTELFQRFKQKYRLDVDKDGEQKNLVKSANEMLRAWKWLTFCGTETIWDAIIEANYLLRKFFLHSRMDEAMELIRMVPETLSDDAIDCFQKKFHDMEVPVRLLDAKYEFECYQFYFEAINRYDEWQKQMEGDQAPEIPQKLSDERWARLDIRRRTEYELSVRRAHDCLQKYYRLVELYKKRVVEMLEHILKAPNGWLVASPLEINDDADSELRISEISIRFTEPEKPALPVN